MIRKLDEKNKTVEVKDNDVDNESAKDNAEGNSKNNPLEDGNVVSEKEEKEEEKIKKEEKEKDENNCQLSTVNCQLLTDGRKCFRCGQKKILNNICQNCGERYDN
jgi:ribosomal protein L32